MNKYSKCVCGNCHTDQHTVSSRDLGRLARIPQRSEDARQVPRRGHTSDTRSAAETSGAWRAFRSAARTRARPRGEATRKKNKKKCKKFLHVTFFL